MWSDAFDDMSRVYVPAGGLVGVEVAGGEVRLRAGETEGWLASEVITCPVGLRFDVVSLDVECPGKSTILLSVLDPTNGSGDAHFANATVPGFVNHTSSAVSLTGLDHTTFTEVRLQATLVADGPDRPRLLGWALHFIPLGEWRDDFTTLAKMRSLAGINMTSGEASLNLQRGRGGLEDYEPFPTVMVFDNNDLKFFHPNGDRTDYLPLEMVDVFRTTGVKFCDLDLDGYLDMLLFGFRAFPDPNGIIICRGEGSGSWDLEHATVLETTGIQQFDLGDFNGDGWPDIAYCANYAGNQGSGIFLNKGHGIISDNPDIMLPMTSAWYMCAGDLNSDGFDDIVLTDGPFDGRRTHCFFGSPDGPDQVPDLEYEADQNVTGLQLFDIDQDGHLDLLMSGRVRFLLGGPDGPDNVTDFEFSYRLGGFTIGDVNNDGHFDLVSNAGGTIRIFNGSDQGWNETSYHEIISPGLGGAMTALDVDLDGFDDILLANETKFKVIFGEAGWPTAPSISMDVLSVGVPSSIATVVHRSNSKGFSGAFTTEPITLPAGNRWDILDLEGTVPNNTSVSITALNGTMQPIEGFMDLTDLNVDLSGLVGERAISISVHIASSQGDVTPVLDRLLVNWMGEWEWREQFYGEAKFANQQGLSSVDGELGRSVDTGGPENGSYLSKPFGPGDADAAGTFHTLRCNARLGVDQSATVQLLDAATLEVLAETPLVDGPNQWALEGLFRVRYHPLVQARILAGGLDSPGEMSIDDLWLNWTPRSLLPPRIVASGLSAPSVHRTETVDLWVDVRDEYDLTDALTVRFEHRLEGESEWTVGMLGPMTYEDGLWTVEVTPAIDAPTGVYRFRANVTDTEGNFTGAVELPSSLEVRSHLPGESPLLVATPGDARVDLEWAEPADAGAGGEVLGYRLFRGMTETSMGLLIALDADVTTFADLDVTNGETYHYAVLARNALGDGPLSRIVNATPRTVPGVPTGLALVAGDGNVSLSWGPPADDGGSGVLSYSILRGASEGSLSPLVQVGGTTYIDAGLTNGETYFYAVAAENGVGLGPRGQALSAMPRGLPGAPRSLSTEVGDANVTLGWLMPLDTGGVSITSYRVYRGEAPDALSLLDELGPGEMGLTDDGVTPGSTYHYAVTALNVVGEGPLSRIVEVLALGRPGAPLGLVAEAGEKSVQLSWEVPDFDGGTGITGYVVLRGTSTRDLEEVAWVGSVLTYKDSGLQGKTSYRYCVVATNALGQGARSDVVTTTLRQSVESEPPIEPNYIVAASAVLLLVAGAFVSSTESFKYWWGLSIVPLFTRLDKDGVLDNKTRLAIHGLVIENPGLHYSEILREFELSNGAAAYHLDVLERENFIRAIRDGRLKRFYSTDTKVPKGRKMTPEETKEAILELVGERPGISQKEIVYELGTGRDSTGYYLRELVRAGLLEDSRMGKYTVYKRVRNHRVQNHHR